MPSIYVQYDCSSIVNPNMIDGNSFYFKELFANSTMEADI